MLPCSACSRMLFFSSSRWPLVVSSGTSGALPGPLWLWLSSGTGGTGFVISDLRYQRIEITPAAAGSFPQGRWRAAAARIVAGRENRFSADTAVTTGDFLEGNRRDHPAGTRQP